MSLQSSRLFLQCLLNSLIHSNLSPDVLFYDSNWAHSENLQWQTDPLLPVPVLGLPHCTQEFSPLLEQPYGCVGTGSTSASETAKTKSQQEQTLQGLKLINSRDFYWAWANWIVFKVGFPEEQYCWYKSSSFSKGPIQSGDSHKHSQIAASTGQAMCAVSHTWEWVLVNSYWKQDFSWIWKMCFNFKTNFEQSKKF